MLFFVCFDCLCFSLINFDFIHFLYLQNFGLRKYGAITITHFGSNFQVKVKLNDKNNFKKNEEYKKYSKYFY